MKKHGQSGDKEKSADERKNNTNDFIYTLDSEVNLRSVVFTGNTMD